MQPKQIERILWLIGEHQERVPELLDLLSSIVKVEGMDMPLKRNQAYVMKYIMQSYNKVAAVLDQPQSVRLVFGKMQYTAELNYYPSVRK